MPDPTQIAASIAEQIEALDAPNPRHLIALAGPPGSGKSTVAEVLVAELQARGHAAALVPMDGFHLDNAILDARGLRPRKGAPETFDLGGFTACLQRLAQGGEVIVPRFDRTRDVSVGSAVVVDAEVTHVVVEGNYLLLDADGWRNLRDLWDFSVLLEEPDATLQARLLQRWKDHGFSPQEAQAKAEGNDLPNARLVAQNSQAPDMAISG